MTALIGREAELEQLTERLEDHRVVTVVGPGGIGKTTLARALAERRGAHYPLGAHFVDLTRVDDGDGVGGALAAQLGFPSFAALLDSPSEQPALLVIDNCEHVLDAAADAVDALLAACDAPAVVATSRSPLDLPGEGVVALGPLATDTWSVELFLQRARAAGTELGDEHREAVEALCRALDGVPLALEIAAARTRVLSPAEILDRLGDLDTLSRHRFRGAERHRALRSAIDWSYVQLAHEDQHRFDRLGVLAGSFDTATAHAVSADDPAADDRGTVAGLETLVHDSLVTADTSGGRSRYRLLHPLRTFALERLAARGELEATWSRFVDHALAVLHELSPPGREAWRPDRLQGLVARADDLLAALRWTVAHDEDPRRAMALLAGLWPVIHQSRMVDTATLGEEALARWPDPEGPAWGDAMSTLATCRQLLGRPHEAIELAHAARGAPGDRSPMAACVLHRVEGRARAALGDPAGAIEAFAATEAVAQEVGILPFAREARTFRAVGLAAVGRTPEAMDLLAENRAEAAAAGDQTNDHWAGVAEGFLLLRDDPARAATTLDDLVETAREIGFGTGVVTALQGLALGRLLAGDDAAACTALGELLDEMTHGGAVSELRSALWTVAVTLHRCDDSGWEDLATTAESLPRISAFADLVAELLPLPTGTGRTLTTPEAVGRARRALSCGDLPPREDAGTTVDTTAAGRFVRAGDAWQVEWAGRALVMRHSKGMGDLARLLASPGQDIHCLELAGAATDQSSTGEVIDGQARRDYEQRIRDLQEEIDEAEAHHDHSRAERAQAEFDAVVEHLASALGLGGRARSGGSTAERARSAVTHRIRATIRRLADEHPELGRHLTASVTTGVYCRYDPEHPTTWEV